MRTTYHSVAKFCHWTIVIIIIAQFVTSEFMASLRFGSVPNIFNTIHFGAWSLLIVPLALALFFMRFYKPVVKVEGEYAAWMDRAATAMQYALYALLVIIPVSGWVDVSIRHLPVDFFGLFALPMLDVAKPSLLHTFGRMHGDLANFIGLLALAHAGAALYHHFILKDQVLNRMRPDLS